MASDIKKILSRGLAKYLGLSEDAFLPIIEVPPDPAFGDFAVPCFSFTPQMKKNPTQIASQFAEQITEQIIHEISISPVTDSRSLIKSTEAKGPYLNIFVNREYIVRAVLEELSCTDLESPKESGRGKTVVIDYSSPNIAKPFGIGHLRSTVIGGALKKIYEYLGYSVIGINHLGDWGTQFGKLITAFRKWGDEGELNRTPIHYLYDLYVKFHKDAEINPSLDEDARRWFNRLEQGDGEALSLWERFRVLSIEEFKKIYHRLGVSFEYYTGESFYSDKLEQTIQEVTACGITTESEGALIVPLEEGLPPALLRKSDNSTLYLTRDIAAALYRQRTYHFDLALYVVGSPQTLHFRQLFSLLKKMRFQWYSRCHHVPFGQIRFEDRSMSTRKGNVVFLEEVLDKSVQLARAIIEEKNPELPNKDEVAEAVGVGSIIFNDLKNNRIKDVVFNWDEILNFNGETGPYLQYTYARIQSLLNKYVQTHGDIGFTDGLPFGEEGYALVLLLNEFDSVILRAAHEFEPSIIARYMLEVASQFNSFYNTHRVVSQDRMLSLSRILLVQGVMKVLGKGLTLLGVKTVDEM
ncbi:MAG: hypothetical protein AMS17_00680 [Spirochaetes bacterium DG_61]|nr:MAG: hypothetical protein AMS17_00680 [Spirochaetes bacterium DG_61]